MDSSSVKSALQISEDEKRKKEQEERAERERIKKKAEAVAPNFVRIAGTWYKKCTNPDGDSILERYSAADIVADYGKKLGPAIMAAAARCINRVNIPSHINYTEYLSTASGDTYYNTYFPLKYKPVEGDWSHIKLLLQHIFGEQYELGLDYVQLLYTQPKRRLPVLVLVSAQNGTGKSTFCNLLKEIFGENAKAITKDTLESRFNSTWATKLLAYCEETLIDNRAVIDRIKNYATAEVVPTEMKGRDMTNEKVYIKLILCSNDEEHPTIIDKYDTRHWVRKIPVITNNAGKAFADQCKEEIPALLHFLLARQLSTEGRDRLWFTHEETVTDAWRKIVAASRSPIEQGVIELLLEIMASAKTTKLLYSATELQVMLKAASALSENDRRKLDRLTVRQMLTKWGLKASKTTKRYDVYRLTDDGHAHKYGSSTGKAYTITKNLLESLTIKDE